MTRRGAAPSLLLAICFTGVAGCGGDEATPLPAHPNLECVGGEKGFHPPPDIDADIDADISGPGASTAEGALRPGLEWIVSELGRGSLVVISGTEYGIAVDGRVVVIHRAITNSEGGCHVVDFFFCSTDETGALLVLDESG